MKPLSDWTADDVTSLIGLQESDSWEFKRDAYGRGDDDIREMLRDISSMANAVGGYLLIGADTDSEERATSFPGIQNATEEELRITSSIRANIEEQIIGFEARSIEVASGRHVLALQIPRSTRAPHMVTFKGLYQCWKRHGRQKSKMTIEEIREACIRIESLRQSLEGFISKRIASVIGTPQAQEVPTLALMATPLVVKDEVIDTGRADVRAVLADPPHEREDGFLLPVADPRPTLYGLRSRNGNGFVELFRNGHLECKRELPRPEKNHFELNPWALAEVPLNFAHAYKAINERAALREPTVFTVALIYASAWKLSEPGYGGGTWTESRDIRLEPFQVPYPFHPHDVARHISNRLWNAFGLERCRLFDGSGHFNPRGLQTTWG